MKNRPLGCSGFYLSLLPYRFTLELFTLRHKKKLLELLFALVTWISYLIETFVCIFVDKIDNQLKILWLSTNLTCRLTIIDKYRVLSTYRLRFRWSTLIDMLRPALSCSNEFSSHDIVLHTKLDVKAFPVPLFLTNRLLEQYTKNLKFKAIKLCDFKMDLIKWQLNWVECNFGLKSYLWNHAYDFRPNCTPLSSITIMNRILGKGGSFMIKTEFLLRSQSRN